MKSKQSVRAEQLSQGSQVCSSNSIVLQARTYIEQKIREGGEGATSIILIQCDTNKIIMMKWLVFAQL